MATINPWNNQVSAAYNQIILNAGTNGVAISTDASAATVNVATGAAVKTSTFGSTNSTSATTVQSGSGALAVTSTNGTLTINSGTGALSISNDASATTVTIATGGAVKTTTLGSTNSTSATTVQSGTGALNITSTNGAQTHNSGTGAMGISTDASATTVSIATGGAVKTVTLGSTNSTSTTTIQSGTGNIIHNTGLTVDSTGRNYNTVQPSFLFNQGSATANNVTGDGTQYTIGSSVALTQVAQQGSGMATGGTFTAPIAGWYLFSMVVRFANIGVATSCACLMVSSDQGTITGPLIAPAALGNVTLTFTQLIKMTASGTVVFKAVASGTTKTVGLDGNAGPLTNTISGVLIC